VVFATLTPQFAGATPIRILDCFTVFGGCIEPVLYAIGLGITINT
jgi:hypothetical protein